MSCPHCSAGRRRSWPRSWGRTTNAKSSTGMTSCCCPAPELLEPAMEGRDRPSGAVRVMVGDRVPLGRSGDEDLDPHGAGLAHPRLEVVRVREADVGRDRLAGLQGEVLRAAIGEAAGGFTDLVVASILQRQGRIPVDETWVG